jgi:hypothetical protein
VFQIRQVLMTRGGFLVEFEVRQVDDAHRDTVECVFHPLSVAFGEIDAGDSRGDLDSDGRQAQTNDLPRAKENLRRQVRKIETELSSGDNAISVWPDVLRSRCPYRQSRADTRGS